MIHPLALVETPHVGTATRVWAWAHVMRGARVGSGCNIGEGVFIEDGVVVGDNVTIKNGVAIYQGVTIESDVFVGPHAVFTNDRRPRSGGFKRDAAYFRSTHLERGATIGANATLICGVRIGTYAMVGAGAVVSRDVPAHTLCIGVPARARGFVCACGETLSDALDCSCSLRYERNGDGLHRLGR